VNNPYTQSKERTDGWSIFSVGNILNPIHLVLVDDQTLVREGLVMLLDQVSGLQVVGSAANGRDAIDVVTTTKPDVVLMDVRMPVMNGVVATGEIKRRFPDMRVIVLTTFDDDEYVFKSLQAGASGYLLKNADPDYLARAIRNVHAGDSVLDPTVTRKVVYQAVGKAESHLVERLTPKEKRVLGLMADGLNNPDIAARLGLSEGTVKNHVSHILAKTSARDRTHAVRLALEWGMLGL